MDQPHSAPWRLDEIAGISLATQQRLARRLHSVWTIWNRKTSGDDQQGRDFDQLVSLLFAVVAARAWRSDTPMRFFYLLPFLQRNLDVLLAWAAQTGASGLTASDLLARLEHTFAATLTMALGARTPAHQLVANNDQLTDVDNDSHDETDADNEENDNETNADNDGQMDSDDDELAHSMLYVLMDNLAQLTYSFAIESNSFGVSVRITTDDSIQRALESLEEMAPWMLDALHLVQNVHWKRVAGPLSRLCLQLPITPPGGLQRLCVDLLESMLFSERARAEGRWSSSIAQFAVAGDEQQCVELQALLVQLLLSRLGSYPTVVAFAPVIREVVYEEVLADAQQHRSATFAQLVAEYSNRPSQHRVLFAQAFVFVLGPGPAARASRPRGLLGRAGPHHLAIGRALPPDQLQDMVDALFADAGPIALLALSELVYLFEEKRARLTFDQWQHLLAAVEPGDEDLVELVQFARRAIDDNMTLTSILLQHLDDDDDDVSATRRRC